MKGSVWVCLVGLLVAFTVTRADDLDIEDAAAVPLTFSDAQQEAFFTEGKQSEFQAEVNRLMEIIINSLYKTRDIFLRELISNAVDAIDKIRYQSLTDKDALGDTPNLEVKVQVDEEAGTLSIIDTGVGMTAEELARNLGTVAHSGTATFLDAFKEASETGENPLQLIGQFGVGFYSAFLVADEVYVVSKSNKDEKQSVWVSKADGKFSVAEDPRGNTLGRGTAVVLKIKEDAREFLDNASVERTVKRYSEFTQYPIYLYSKRVEEREEEIPEDELEDEEKPEGEEDELSTEDEEEEDKKPKTRKVEETFYFWKRLNSNKPIWARRASSVEDEEYEEFYKAFTRDSSAPLAHTHFKAEGELEFDSMIFIPEKAPSQFYDNYYQSKSKLRLYVRRVLVADEFEDIIPRYLQFVRGLVDSNDLPLNVNREDLQKNKVMTVISRKLTRKVLDLLRKLARDEEDDEEEEEEEEEGDKDVEEEEEGEEKKEEGKYSKFWKEFGKSIKLGVLEDSRNKKRLVELLRFQSTESPDTPISLQSYVSRMKPGQKFIYFVASGSVDEAENSPFLERFRNKGYEVLYFVDNLDEYMQLGDYDDFPFQSISKENVELDGKKMKDFLKEKEEEFEDLKKWLKDTYKGKISRVQISNTLDISPMAIATTSWGTSARQEKIARAQAFGGSAPMRATKILQINYRHPIINELKNRVDDNEDDEELKDLANLLLDMALVQSGFEIEADEQTSFAERITRIVQSGLKIPADAELEAMPEFADEEDVEEEEDEYEDFDDDEEEMEDEEKAEL